MPKRDFYSAPGKRAIGLGEQLPLVITVKSKGPQEGLLFSHYLFCHELSNTDHLVSVAGIRDQITILSHNIEYGKIIRGEGPEPARWLFPVTMILVFIPFLTVSQGGCPCVGEFRSNYKIRGINAVWVNRHLLLLYKIRRGSPLNALEVKIGLVVDPPRLFNDKRAVLA